MSIVGRFDYFEKWDVQQQCSVADCPRCMGEIYRYDMVADISGRLVHEDCMNAEEQEEYLVNPASSFFEDAC